MQVAQETVRRLSRARDLLSDAQEPPFSIRQVARQVGISPFHFIRQFAAVFGTTPHQFRIKARIEHAKELLVLDRLSVTDVCMEVGFSSLGSFSGLFTRWVGATPSEYRRKVRTTVQVPASLTELVVADCLGLLAFLPPSAFSQFSRS